MLVLLALVAVLMLSSLATLGNFYYTYGIWPQSWGAFVLFSFIHLVVIGIANSVTKELRD